MKAGTVATVIFVVAGLGVGGWLMGNNGGAARRTTAGAAAGANPAAEPQKLVITHVMHQLAVGAVNGRNETHLSVEPTRDKGVLAIHTPEYIANYGQPLAAARQDIARMKQAGINTIALLLGNDHLPNSQFAPMIHAYFQAALEDGEIKIYPDLWGRPGEPQKLAEAMGLLYEKYAPAWRTHQGKLMVSVVLNDYSGTPGKKPEYSATTAGLFAKIGGRERVWLIGYDPQTLRDKAPDWLRGCDALTDWVHMSYGESRGQLARAMETAAAAGKPFLAPVMPAFAQSRYPHPGVTPNLREMLGPCWFRHAWMNAIRSGAGMAYIQTWNDLSEDSAMMPESNHGEAYYELGKYYIRWFQAGKKPPVEREQILLFHHPQIVEGVLLPAGRRPMEDFPVSHGNRFDDHPGRTPSTDYLAVTAMLKAPARVRVMLGETVLAQRDFAAGMQTWLVYQPRSQNDPRGLHRHDPATAYPPAEDDLFLTPIDRPFFDAEVFVAVERGAERIGFFRSHHPVAGAAARGDLTVTGDAFALPASAGAPAAASATPGK